MNTNTYTKRERLNLFNIMAAAPDTDINVNEVVYFNFIEDLVDIANTERLSLTIDELKALDTWMLRNLHLDNDVDINWVFDDDMKSMMLEDDAYLDTCGKEHFIERAIKIRAHALSQNHKLVIIDMYIDIMLTHKYLTMLQDCDYRLEFYEDYANALVTACANLDSALYFCI